MEGGVGWRMTEKPGGDKERGGEKPLTHSEATNMVWSGFCATRQLALAGKLPTSPGPIYFNETRPNQLTVKEGTRIRHRARATRGV